MGGKVDVGPDKDHPECPFLGQCKEVQHLSLAELTRLVVEVEAKAEKEGRAGVVLVKLRAGKGRATPLLVVQTEKSWRALS